MLTTLRRWCCIGDIKAFAIGTLPVILISSNIFGSKSVSLYIIYSVILFFSKLIFHSGLGMNMKWPLLESQSLIKVFYSKPCLLSVNLCLAVKTTESGLKETSFSTSKTSILAKSSMGKILWPG